VFHRVKVSRKNMAKYIGDGTMPEAPGVVDFDTVMPPGELWHFGGGGREFSFFAEDFLEHTYRFKAGLGAPDDEDRGGLDYWPLVDEWKARQTPIERLHPDLPTPSELKAKLTALLQPAYDTYVTAMYGEGDDPHDDEFAGAKIAKMLQAVGLPPLLAGKTVVCVATTLFEPESYSFHNIFLEDIVAALSGANSFACMEHSAHAHAQRSEETQTLALALETLMGTDALAPFARWMRRRMLVMCLAWSLKKGRHYGSRRRHRRRRRRSSSSSSSSSSSDSSNSSSSSSSNSDDGSGCSDDEVLADVLHRTVSLPDVLMHRIVKFL
jgi:hypothetical protein